MKPEAAASTQRSATSALQPAGVLALWSTSVELERRSTVSALQRIGRLDKLLEHSLAELRNTAVALEAELASLHALHAASDRRSSNKGIRKKNSDLTRPVSASKAAIRAHKQRLATLERRCVGIQQQKMALADNVAASIRTLYMKVGKYR